MPFRSRHPSATHAETFTCPRCGAVPQQQCQTRNGTPSPYPHVGRVYLGQDPCSPSLLAARAEAMAKYLANPIGGKR